MKNKVFTPSGTRTFYSKKGCHSCTDCKHLLTARPLFEYWTCELDSRKNSISSWKFPYDNTICSQFEDTYEQ